MPFSDAVRIGVPQVLTGSRIMFGAAAMIGVSRGDAHLAATLITLGAVTDGLDGAAARWLGGTTAFGIWFDYFSDYICYIVAPWTLARLLLVPGGGAITEVVVAVPLITGAIRYARNGMLLGAAGAHPPELPGLGTVFFAFVPVTAVFLEVYPLAFRWGTTLFLAMILAFSTLMNAPVRFPKLTRLRGVSPVVLILLAVQPFWMTRVIAGATLVLGLSYVFFAARSSRVPDRPPTSQASRTRATI